MSSDEDEFDDDSTDDDDFEITGNLIFSCFHIFKMFVQMMVKMTIIMTS